MKFWETNENVISVATWKTQRRQEDEGKPTRSKHTRFPVSGYDEQTQGEARITQKKLKETITTKFGGVGREESITGRQWYIHFRERKKERERERERNRERERERERYRERERERARKGANYPASQIWSSLIWSQAQGFCHTVNSSRYEQFVIESVWIAKQIIPSWEIS